MLCEGSSKNSKLQNGFLMLIYKQCPVFQTNLKGGKVGKVGKVGREGREGR